MSRENRLDIRRMKLNMKNVLLLTWGTGRRGPRRLSGLL